MGLRVIACCVPCLMTKRGTGVAAGKAIVTMINLLLLSLCFPDVCLWLAIQSGYRIPFSHSIEFRRQRQMDSSFVCQREMCATPVSLSSHLLSRVLQSDVIRAPCLPSSSCLWKQDCICFLPASDPRDSIDSPLTGCMHLSLFSQQSILFSRHVFRSYSRIDDALVQLFLCTANGEAVVLHDSVIY